MCICFVEYHIEVHFVASYLRMDRGNLAGRKWSQALRRDGPAQFICRSMGSGGRGSGAEHKRRTLQPAFSWHRMAEWVPGGAPKIHAWTFKPVLVQV